MAVNPDPKPGRWILPLVILGMIAFTYFFVRELPEASPDTTLAGPVTTTTVPDTTATTEEGGGDGQLDAETQAYLDELDAINADLQLVETEIVRINTGFDADPREIEYSDAETGFEEVQADTEALEARVDALSPPVELQVNHEALTTAIRFASGAAGDALDGLRSSDTGELRRNAVQAYVQAAQDFDSEITNAHNAAGDTS